MGLASGCTILQPVTGIGEDRRFALDFPSAERVPCVDARGDGQLCDAAVKDSLDGFHAGLGRAIWEMDVRRRELVRQAADHTNLNASYNTLLWPLGAYFVTRKIHHPSWSTLDVAALATATYGLLGSGIPDRDKLYLKTAARMACTLVEFEPELYPVDAILRAVPSEPARWEEASLQERLVSLRNAKDSFESGRDRLATSLTLEPAKSRPKARSESERLRMESLGLGGQAASAPDPTNDFLLETGRQLDDAADTLKAGQRLKQQLDGAGVRLRQQRSRIEAALTQALNERTPALDSPFKRGGEITQSLAQLSEASKQAAAKLKKESGRSRLDAWQPTPARLKALEDTSRKELIGFWTTKRPALRQAQADLADWIDRHDERRRAAQAMAEGMGCNDGNLAAFTAALIQGVGDAAKEAAKDAAKEAAKDITKPAGSGT